MRTDRSSVGCTRRSALAYLFAAPLSSYPGKGRWYASDWKQVADPATEFPLLRLTDPSYSSRLPASRLRWIARSGRFLLFSSGRAGTLQVFRLDLTTGRQQQLTEAADLDALTPALMPDDQSFCYWDGGVFWRVNLKNLREKEICRASEGWRRGEGFSLARDGSHAAWAETAGQQRRVRVVRVSSGRVLTVAEGFEPLGDPALHSRRAGLLYRDGSGGLVLAGLDGRSRRRLALPAGELGHFVWAPDGKSVFYLHSPGGRTATLLREHRLDAGADQVVAATSAWQIFSVNSDATVFVGASGSLAAPYVLLMLRAGGRERVLCEHRASQASQTCCVFAPDSQRVYFQTDREGRWTVYCVPVERLVEPTPAQKASL